MLPSFDYAPSAVCICWNLHSQVITRDRGWQVLGPGGFLNVFSVYLKRLLAALKSFCHGRWQWADGYVWGRYSHSRHQTYWCLGLEISSSRILRNTIRLLISQCQMCVYMCVQPTNVWLGLRLMSMSGSHTWHCLAHQDSECRQEPRDWA